MEAADLKAGDVVCLNSTSPKMTVKVIDGNDVKLIYWNSHIFKFEELITNISTIFKSKTAN